MLWYANEAGEPSKRRGRRMSLGGRSRSKRGETTLLCGDAMGGGLDDACERALDPGTDGTVLWVSYTRSPNDCFDRLPDVPAERKAVVDVGGGTRSAAASGNQRTATPGGSVTVADPNDLTGIGIAVTDRLDEDVHVCFDSVTAMLQYVETDRAYTFLNSLLGHLWNANASAHFHFNPGAHDDRTVAVLTSLFDARIDADGTVRPSE